MAAELTMFVSEQKGWNIIVLVLTSLFLSLRNRTKTQPYPNSHFVADNKSADVNNPLLITRSLSLDNCDAECHVGPVSAPGASTGQFPIFLMT